MQMPQARFPRMPDYGCGFLAVQASVVRPGGTAEVIGRVREEDCPFLLSEANDYFHWPIRETGN